MIGVFCREGLLAGGLGEWKLKKSTLVILKLSASLPRFHLNLPYYIHLLSTALYHRGKQMDMNTLNVSATLNIFRLFAKPSLCLPQATISTFNHLPIPLNAAFDKRYGKVDIRAVVLDKDNCFARPGSNEVYGPYEVGLLTSDALTLSSTKDPHVYRTFSKFHIVNAD